MPESLIFSINESETKKQKALFIDASAKLPEELAYLNLKKVPFDKSYQVLKLLAANGALHFKDKRLIVDLFSKASLAYHIQQKETQFEVLGSLCVRNQEFHLADLDLLVLGKPSWFIKGTHLHIIDDNIGTSVLSSLPLNLKNSNLLAFIAEAKEDGIAVKGLEGLSLKQSEPLPILKLRDRTGAFADLWMDYGSEGSYNYDSPHHNPLRNQNSEKQWENDLLETDFIKKRVGSTAYYCPLDRVAKALSFLLEIGWNIIDFQGKTVVRETGKVLHADLHSNSVLIAGEVHYGSFKANVQDVAGSFIRKERFLNLDEHTVGLINDNVPFGDYAEAGEIISEGIALSRYTLKDLFEKDIYKLSPNLAALQEKCACSPITSLPFKGTLRPYQEKGMEWLFDLYGLRLGAILADDMGLGKTIQILAFLAQLQPIHCHVIVVPTSLLFNWESEIRRFLPNMPCFLHHGGSRGQELPTCGIILTSYTTLRNDFMLFEKHAIHCLILDEAQAIKNQETKIAQTLSRIVCDFRICITGTPIENHIEELFAHFNFLMPGFLNSQDQSKRLQQKIRPFILRRRKEEVAPDLPEKIEQIIYVEMTSSQRSAYDSFLSSFKKNILCKIALDGASKHRMAIFEALLRLRQICCHPLLANHEADSGKMEIFLDDVTSVLAQGRKALVFSQFTSMLNLISKELRARGIEHIRLDGNTKDRASVVQEFQNSDIPLFLISLKAGGVGLNLTEADHVFIYDPWWNDAVEEQAISRAHRIGQSKTVVAKRYVTLESIEEKMMKMKESKNKLIQELLTEEFSASVSFSNDELLALFD